MGGYEWSNPMSSGVAQRESLRCAVLRVMGSIPIQIVDFHLFGSDGGSRDLFDAPTVRTNEK